MRAEVLAAERVVVKIGSSSLTDAAGFLDPQRIRCIAQELSQLHARGVKVVLVSSGAIAAALRPLGLNRRPRDLATQQAAAAFGQGLLIQHYAEIFGEYGVAIAQLLLTVEDVLRPGTYRNALNTISRLLRFGVVPIINENDTVATQEIRFGDNDRLAALIAHLMRADVLLLMSDVAGLYTAHPDTPGARKIDRVDDIAALQVDTSRVGSRVGTGGMRTKLLAADIATRAGVHVVLGSTAELGQAIAGQPVGTFFPARTKRRPRRLLWLAFAAEPRGSVRIDEGARLALVEQHASLLLAGVQHIAGVFASGDPIEIFGPEGDLLGRGFAGYSSVELQEAIALNRLAGRRPVVHRDAMMLTAD